MLHCETPSSVCSDVCSSDEHLMSGHEVLHKPREMQSFCKCSEQSKDGQNSPLIRRRHISVRISKVGSYISGVVPKKKRLGLACLLSLPELQCLPVFAEENKAILSLPYFSPEVRGRKEGRKEGTNNGKRYNNWDSDSAAGHYRCLYFCDHPKSMLQNNETSHKS